MPHFRFTLFKLKFSVEIVTLSSWKKISAKKNWNKFSMKMVYSKLNSEPKKAAGPS